MNIKFNESTKITIITVLVVLVSGLILTNLGEKNSSTKKLAVNNSEKVIIYKSPTCGCCTNYASYLKKEGYDVEVVLTEDMETVKEKYNIPASMQSCHTSVIGDKVIEGHMPVQALQAVLKDETVNTILMPGMPVGSPGMPGKKTEEFKIFSMDVDGNISQFMTL